MARLCIGRLLAAGIRAVLYQDGSSWIFTPDGRWVRAIRCALCRGSGTRCHRCFQKGWISQGTNTDPEYRKFFPDYPPHE